MASTNIIIANGSTSKTVYVDLGVTGLTYNSAGLTAYYVSSRIASSAITLVTRTIAQDWISGGFCEVNATYMPGIYRFDIPNNVIQSNFGQSVVVFKNGSGVLGSCVITDAQPSSNKVCMGPFSVQNNGVLSDEALTLLKGSSHSLEVQLVDQFGNGVNLSGSTVVANVYNYANTLSASYTCTDRYSIDGFYSFNITTAVTNTVGQYSISIVVTSGASTYVFGRMKLTVSNL